MKNEVGAAAPTWDRARGTKREHHRLPSRDLGPFLVVLSWPGDALKEGMPGFFFRLLQARPVLALLGIDVHRIEQAPVEHNLERHHRRHLPDQQQNEQKSSDCRLLDAVATQTISEAIPKRRLWRLASIIHRARSKVIQTARRRRVAGRRSRSGSLSGCRSGVYRQPARGGHAIVKVGLSPDCVADGIADRGAGDIARRSQRRSIPSRRLSPSDGSAKAPWASGREPRRAERSRRRPAARPKQPSVFARWKRASSRGSAAENVRRRRDAGNPVRAV